MGHSTPKGVSAHRARAIGLNRSCETPDSHYLELNITLMSSCNLGRVGKVLTLETENRGDLLSWVLAYYKRSI